MDSIQGLVCALFISYLFYRQVEKALADVHGLYNKILRFVFLFSPSLWALWFALSFVMAEYYEFDRFSNGFFSNEVFLFFMIFFFVFQKLLLFLYKIVKLKVKNKIERGKGIGCYGFFNTSVVNFLIIILSVFYFFKILTAMMTLKADNGLGLLLHDMMRIGPSTGKWYVLIGLVGGSVISKIRENRYQTSKKGISNKKFIVSYVVFLAVLVYFNFPSLQVAIHNQLNKGQREKLELGLKDRNDFLENEILNGYKNCNAFANTGEYIPKDAQEGKYDLYLKKCQDFILKFEEKDFLPDEYMFVMLPEILWFDLLDFYTNDINEQKSLDLKMGLLGRRIQSLYSKCESGSVLCDTLISGRKINKEIEEARGKINKIKNHYKINFK